ncbi:CHAT domain-containing protein [Intrasporangium sp.]|uniref:CHAT domain-containing protein n=1 Tax=Intrasporangium sp. TaxID=1925024 RepID=UPI0033656484
MAGPSGYVDVDLVVTQRGDLLETRVLDSPAGETGTLTAPLPSTLDGDDKDVGDALFAALFPSEVRLRYEKSTDRAFASGVGVRVVLRFEGGADRLPWELLRDPGRFQFMALDPWRAVVRCTEMQTREPAAARPTPLRILLAVSTPDGTPAIDAAAEIVRIQSRLRPYSWGAAVEVVTLRTASLETIRQTLQSKEFHVFHYVGHASHPVGGTGHLDLTAADGTVSSRPADEVAAILAGSPTLRLAVLNCCDSSVSDRSDPFAGTATALVRAGVPAVVAMRRAITDTAAVLFADEFYGALIESGGRVEQAVARGRAALFAAEGPTAAEWSTVALHLGSSLGAEDIGIPVPGLDRDVQFTVSHPAELRPTVWEPLLFFAHHGERQTTASGEVIDQTAEVGDRVATFFAGAPSQTTAALSTQPVPRGAGLIVRPDLPGLECSPPQAAVTWTGEIAELTFLLRAREDLVERTVEGQVRVFSGPLVIAEAAVALVVASSAAAQPSSRHDQPAQRFGRIFPCYAPEDADLVEGVVAVAEALGDGYLSEIVAERRSGAPLEWMRAKIAEADSFQLFWSSRSMTSATCRNEWEAALSTHRADFVRPLYWEEPFPHSEGLPPPDLAALRFVRLPVPKGTVSGNLWAPSDSAAQEPAQDVYRPVAPAPEPILAPPAPAPSPQTYPPSTPAPPPASWQADSRSAPPSAAGPARGLAPGLGAVTGLLLTVAGLIGGPWLSLQPGAGPSEHTTYWWLIVPGVLLLVLSVSAIVARMVVRRR